MCLLTIIKPKVTSLVTVKANIELFTFRICNVLLLRIHDINTIRHEFNTKYIKIMYSYNVILIIVEMLANIIKLSYFIVIYCY